MNQRIKQAYVFEEGTDRGCAVGPQCRRPVVFQPLGDSVRRECQCGRGEDWARTERGERAGPDEGMERGHLPSRTCSGDSSLTFTEPSAPGCLVSWTLRPLSQAPEVPAGTG